MERKWRVVLLFLFIICFFFHVERMGSGSDENSFGESCDRLERQTLRIGCMILSCRELDFESLVMLAMVKIDL